MVNMKTLSQFKKESLKKPAVKSAYNRITPEVKIIKRLVEKRIAKRMSQRDFAQEIGITQSSLARFESGSSNPTLSFLQKIASGLGLSITIK
jgi:predicted transcriptional regulator